MVMGKHLFFFFPPPDEKGHLRGRLPMSGHMDTHQIDNSVVSCPPPHPQFNVFDE